RQLRPTEAKARSHEASAARPGWPNAGALWWCDQAPDRVANEERADHLGDQDLTEAQGDERIPARAFAARRPARDDNQDDPQDQRAECRECGRERHRPTVLAGWRGLPLADSPCSARAGRDDEVEALR